MVEMLIGYAVAFLVFQPLNVFIHELGHAFFVKIFGGKVLKIEIGIGEPVVNLGLIQVNKQFIWFGLCRIEYTPTNTKSPIEKIKLSLIALGGVIFNLISILLLIAIKLSTTHHHFLDGYFFGFTGILILTAIIPMTYFTGDKSDGATLMNIWK